MKIRINRKVCSGNPHFPVVNQGNEQKTKMCCTIYAPYISLNWNSNINKKLGLQTEEEAELILNKIIDRQVDLGLLSLTKGGKGSDGVEAIEKEFKANVIEFKKYNIKDLDWIKKLLAQGQAITIGIYIDIDYLIDSQDGVLDGNWQSMINGKKFGHFTTLVGANSDVVKFEGGYKYAIVDSYAFNKKGREWVYKFNDLDGFIKYIAMNTMYFIF